MFYNPMSEMHAQTCKHFLK